MPRGLCSLVLLALLAACGAAQPVAPGKVVSNNPCVDAILAEVALPDQVGAVSIWSQDTKSASAPVAWARRFPAIGAEAEAIIAARPALALIGSFGKTEPLDSAGVEYLAFGVPVSVIESLSQVRKVAGAIGRHEAGERLAAAIQAAAIPTDTGQKGSPTAIIWLSGGFVPGKGTLQDELLARAGYRNASTAYDLKQWDVLPLETLIRNPPDVIFTPATADGSDARTLALREALLDRLPSRPRVVAFPEKLLNCGGPSIIAAMKILRS